MAHRDLIVIGASAGGLQALSRIVADLPPDLPACVLVVVHTSSDGHGLLPQILARRTQLPVAFASDRAPLTPGRIFVAPADHHLLVLDGHLELSRGPRENGFRPAVDPLFRSAARAHGDRVIGVILSGALDDGSYGLSVIKRSGGLVMVQDPSDAEIPGMPRGALRETEADAVLPAAAIAARLVDWCGRPAAGAQLMARKNDPETQLPDGKTEVADMNAIFGQPSGLTCPDCGGALWEIVDGTLVRYRCHVGHQYAPDSLLAGQRDAVESALWSAVRALEEHAHLRDRMARRAETAGLMAVSKGFSEKAGHSHRQAQQIRTLLFGGGDTPSDRLATERAELSRSAVTKTVNNRAREKPGARPTAKRQARKKGARARPRKSRR